MSYLSFGHHRNLQSVTIPNNVLVGEDGDFSGRFSIEMGYNRKLYYGETIPTGPPYYDYAQKLVDKTSGYNDSYNDSFNKPNVSLTPCLLFNNCPPLKHINIGRGYSINLNH